MKIPAGPGAAAPGGLTGGWRQRSQARLVISPDAGALDVAVTAEVAHYSRPAVLAAGRSLQQQMKRRRENQAFQAAGTRPQAALAEFSFHPPNGTTVVSVGPTRQPAGTTHAETAGGAAARH